MYVFFKQAPPQKKKKKKNHTVQGREFSLLQQSSRWGFRLKIDLSCSS